uniref:Nck-associated protein 5 C-terminal domain-containing protein n=1 Tax=Oncorhynchus kisutch TaxID=8019 RepID=A0A8C7FJ76_ONCKI
LHGMLIHVLEEERRLRLDSEKRLREVTDESELGRAQMVSLQQHFSRMEETVRTLLQNQGVLEQTAVDTVDIMKAYKVTPHCSALLQNALYKAKPWRLSSLNVFYFAVQEENSALAMENESQREQYEHCLDEVSSPRLALFTQPDLREECLKLRTRVFDLEQQNRTMSVLFQQRVRPASDLLHGENEEEPNPETSCQDHMIGSSCQMRTLDSGIGTFPLPDSVTRVNGRHIPRSESSPDRTMASVHSPTDPEQDLVSASAAHSPSHVTVPSLSESQPHVPPTSALGHSLSDSTVTGRGCGQEALSRLPRPSTSDTQTH